MTTRNKILTGLAALALSITGWCTYDILSTDTNQDEDTIEDVRNVEDDEVLETKVEAPEATPLAVPATLPSLDLERAPEGLGKQVFEDYLKEIQKDTIDRDPCLPMPWDNILAPRFAEIQAKYGLEETVKVAIDFARNYFADPNCNTGWAIGKISKGLNASAKLDFYRGLIDVVESRKRISYGIEFLELLKKQKLSELEKKDQIDQLCSGEYASLKEPCLDSSKEHYSGLKCRYQLEDSKNGNVCRLLPAYFSEITSKLAKDELGEIPPEFSIPLEYKNKKLSYDEMRTAIMKLSCKNGKSDRAVIATIDNYELIVGKTARYLEREIFEALSDPNICADLDK